MTGLRFLFRVTLRRLDLAAEIYHLREPQKIPLVISTDEAKRLLAVAKTLKVRVLLSLAYGCGLRAGEVVRLRVGDIDIAQNIIRVVQAKGRKDRNVMLSPDLLGLLRKWWKLRPNRYDHGVPPGERWLFPGRRLNRPITTRQLSLCLVKTPSAAEIVAFPATAGYRRRHAHDHHDSRRHAAQDLPQPRVATPGKPRSPPAGGNSEAGKATAVAPDARPLVLGHLFPPLAALARGAGDRKAGNRHRLAPERISCVLDPEIQARQTRTASGAQ